MLLAFFLTPLVFFLGSRDQFELPKLTFLALLVFPPLLLSSKDIPFGRLTPIPAALLLFLAVQIASSLPGVSLSWQTSLLGDYENFSGLWTFLTYLAWFWVLSRDLSGKRIEKILYFNGLAALLSALYAIGQRYGFDFIQWNPNSVNSSREFASLGNPNFLSAYLAMSIPLFFFSASNNRSKAGSGSQPLSWVLGLLGSFFLFLGTAKGVSLLGLALEDFPRVLFRTLGLASLSVALVRPSLTASPLWMPLGTFLLSLGLFSTESRGGFLGALAGLLLWFFLDRSAIGSSREADPKPNGGSKAYLGGAFALLALPLLFFGRPFLERLWSSTLHAGESLENSRLTIWGPALKMVQAHPFLGIGLDTFKIAFPSYSGIEFNRIDGMFVSSRAAHNELLQIASTTGLLGLSAYLILLFAFVRISRENWKALGSHHRSLLAALLASALAYQVQNLFSFGVAALNLLWFLILAIADHFHRSRQGSSTATAPPQAFSMGRSAILVFLTVLFLFIPLRRLAADIAYARGAAASELLKRDQNGSDPNTWKFYSDYEIRQNKRAYDLCPLEVKYLLYLGLAYEKRAAKEPELGSDWYQKALACYQGSLRMNPSNAYYHNNLGRVYAALGKRDPSAAPLAEAAYQRSVELAPRSPLFILNWAISLEGNGKGEEAGGAFRRAFTLDPAFCSKTLAQMGLDEYGSGNVPTAFQRLQEAIQGNDKSPEAFYCRGLLYLEEKNKKKALVDLEKAKSLGPTPESNPSIRSLDQLIEQAKR